jgi:DNA-binding Xre family transcriptional regulator
MAATFRVHLKRIILQKAIDSGQSVMTQKEIHEATKLSLPTIGRWMSGKVDRVEADTVSLLTKFLGCKMSDLIELEEIEESQKDPEKV